MSITRAKGPWTIILCSMLILSFAPIAIAEEGGAISYPIGAETVMPAYAPPPKVLVLQEFTLFYSASRFNDSHGNSGIPGFRATIFANCVKFKYDWGVKFLGGNLMSAFAPVVLYEQVEAGGQSQTKTRLANQNMSQFVVYNKRSLFWQYGVDVWTPGPSYKQSDMTNVGQHYWEFEPTAAITWLPNKGKTELSTRVHYGLATTNPDNHYHSGNTFVWEFNTTQNVTKRLALGFQGYLLKQVRDDTIHGVTVGDGNRSQALGLGPQVRLAVGNGVLAFKYFRETEARYHPVGNGYWFEFGVPIGKFGPKEKPSN